MPTTIRSAVVFCGSRPGRNPAWREAAQTLGRGMAQAGIRLVYGGGRTGLMGAVADGALAAGGTVTGIIPRFLQAREVAHVGVQEMIVTDSMHSRKQLMFEHADAFVTLRAGWARWTRPWRSSPGGSSACTTSRSWWPISTAGPRR